MTSLEVFHARWQRPNRRRSAHSEWPPLAANHRHVWPNCGPASIPMFDFWSPPSNSSDRTT